MFERVENTEKSKTKEDKFDATFHRAFRPSELPPAHGEAHDVVVYDKMGHRLTLRTENGTRQHFIAAREKDSERVDHATRIRIYEVTKEGTKEVGSANLNLEIKKQFNSVSGHNERVTDIRMRLQHIFVPENGRRQGIGSILLERVEELARQSGARELYGTVGSELGHNFFAAKGHEFRQGNQGGTSQEHFRSFYFS